MVRDYDPSIPDVLIDREQMIQAVLNIVRNAMQAISSQNELRLGRISLRTRAMRQFTIGHVRHRLVTKIEIIDNGPGIPAELQETIFFPWSAAVRTVPGWAWPLPRTSSVSIRA